MSFTPSTCCPKPAASPFSMPSRTAIEWALANPVLAPGACAYESDTGKWKLGNGKDSYLKLEYQSESGSSGAAGPKGDIGPVGPVGPPCNLRIGSVTEGTTAAATITGTSPNYTLNLVLPSAGSTSNPTEESTKISFSIQPQSEVALEADAVVLTAAASDTDGSNLSYKWQRQAAASGAWVDFAYGQQLVFNAALANNGDTFRCVASSSASGSKFSDPAGLKVFPQSAEDYKFTAQPLPAFVRSGSVARFVVGVTFTSQALAGTVNDYQWYKDSTAISGERSQVLSVNAVDTLNGSSYYCTIKALVPGGPFLKLVTSNPAKLTVT